MRTISKDAFVSLPTHLPVAPRPLGGELLSSWLERLAAANALSFGELLEALRVRLAPSRAAEFYPHRLDYGCSRPLTKALSTLSRWSAARGGFSLLEHLQRGSCHAADDVSRPLWSAGSEAFGMLGRQTRFELLAGVVELVGTGEERSRGTQNPFCCVYGPMSAGARREFLQRLRSWPERVRVKALTAVACF